MTDDCWERCPHFGVCGGCQLQNMSREGYQTYKRDKIVRALDQENIVVPEDGIRPYEGIPPQTRRRVTFKALRTSEKVLLGFYQEKTHHVVDLTACQVILPSLFQLMEPLREFLLFFLAPLQKAQIFITQCDQGLDVFLSRSPASSLSLNQRERAVSFAQEYHLARLWMDHEPLWVPTVPTVSFGGVPVPLMTHSFLQASSFSDMWIAERVCHGIQAAQPKRVADLFCGLGTLSLPLAQLLQKTGGKVTAYEKEEAALSALKKAVSQSSLPLSVAAPRDLFQNPLTPQELNVFQSVVMNPPREGAATQAKNIALSKVSQVIMVSCNPRSFARDVRILIQKGGFQVNAIYPFDQFLWSQHVEAVSFLER